MVVTEERKTRVHDLRVLEVIAETDDACSIVLEAPAELEEQLRYLPGQFLTVRIPLDGGEYIARSYSLCSSPGIDRHLKVTVKRTRDGRGSNWLCDNVKAGDELRILAPSGVFTAGADDHDLVLLAGGSGITPIMSILKSALWQGHGRVHLAYANRTRSSIIFGRELQELQLAHADRFTIEHWLDDEGGVATTEAVRSSLARLETIDRVLVCGPGPFMDVVEAGVADAGLPRGTLRREVFRSLSDDPFAEPSASLSPVSAEGSGQQEAVRTVVELGGQRIELLWPKTRSLVDALLERNVDVPYSCRSGECGSCACNVVGGVVDMPSSDILDPEDIADGFILACQARPVSGPVEVKF